jgi:hypothetical protein
VCHTHGFSAVACAQESGLVASSPSSPWRIVPVTQTSPGNLDAADSTVSTVTYEYYSGATDYITEKDIPKCVEHPEGNGATPELTPDFLFDPPLVIHGQVIRWIEVKNSLCIPDVSFDSQSDIKLQAQKYVKRFGQGAFVWTKCGFAESLDKFFDMPGVMNFSYTVAHTGQRPAPNSS